MYVLSVSRLGVSAMHGDHLSRWPEPFWIGSGTYSEMAGLLGRLFIAGLVERGEISPTQAAGAVNLSENAVLVLDALETRES